MKKCIAKTLRRAAARLDPPPAQMFNLFPQPTSTANGSSVGSYTVRFDPEAAGRRAVRKHGRALRLLGMDR